MGGSRGDVKLEERAVDKLQAFAYLWAEVPDLINKESLSSRALSSQHIFVQFNLICCVLGMRRAWVDICPLSRSQVLLV